MQIGFQAQFLPDEGIPPLKRPGRKATAATVELLLVLDLLEVGTGCVQISREKQWVKKQIERYKWQYPAARFILRDGPLPKSTRIWRTS